MPEPKISAVLNNCSLHAITPEIKAEVLKFAADAHFDNRHNAHYLTLKNDFATFYGFDPLTFSWIQFAGILDRHNVFDIQILMGPVLRLFSTHSIRRDNELPNFGILVDQYVTEHTEISPHTGRYTSLSPDHLYKYICSDLGLSLTYHRAENPSRSETADHSIARVNIYHQGDIGGGANGHWERTNEGRDSIDYQAHGDTQLIPLLSFLGGENPALTPYGIELLKKHIQLSNRSIVERVPLNDEFAEHRATIAQIEKYLKNILYVSKGTASKLLGEGLTEITRKFIESYNIPSAPSDDFKNIELYLNNPEKGVKPRGGSDEEKLLIDLRAPVLQAPIKMVTLPPSEVIDPEHAARVLREEQAKALQEQQRAKELADALQEQRAKELANALQEQRAKELADALQEQRAKELADALQEQRAKELANALQEQRAKELADALQKLKTPKVTQAQKKFNGQLKLLSIKTDELETRKIIAYLEGNGDKCKMLEDAQQAASDLHQGLTAAGIIYFNKPTQEAYETFKVDCKNIIKTAHVELDKHRGWSEFLTNLLLTLPLFVGVLIKGIINIANNNSFFYVHKTDSAKIVDSIELSVDGANPGTAPAA